MGRRFGGIRLIAGVALATAVLGALAALMLSPTHAVERGHLLDTRQEPEVAPPGAVVLFDGTDTAEWRAVDGGPAGWPIVDGALVAAAGSGDVRTVRDFGDFRLHLEFWLPATPADAPEQDRANSGIYLQGRYELQVLDSFGRALADANDAGAVYGLKDPDANATLPAETWQVYDVSFQAARWSGENKLENARVTVRLNGVTIHDDVELPGPTAGGDAERPMPGPILLQDHGNPVQYRNIWVLKSEK
jgi:hypothetical protein